MVEVAERQKDRHECEVCGYSGPGVIWQVYPLKSGYFCDDGHACFERYRQQRNQEPEESSGDA